MKRTITVACLAGAILHSPIRADEAASEQTCVSPPTVIQSVRVFDGTDIIPEATVIIRCKLIERVIDNGDITDIPMESLLIDGRGKFLLPGLIDSHTHTFNRETLERSLDFGVTTVLDMGSLASGFKQAIDAEDAQGQVDDRADLLGAVVWVTAPGSHGTQFGESPTLEDPKEADEFIAKRVADGADFIKIIYDNFKMFDRPVPTLSQETMQAAVIAAHAHGRMAVFHSRDVEAYTNAALAGADGFVHLPVDEVPGEELLTLLKEEEIFVMPNLSLARPDGIRLAEDPVIGPMLTEDEISNLKRFRALHREGGDRVVYDSVKVFRDKGVTILSGTDSPNSGTTAGASMHLELELLVEAGLTPVEAMAAATSTPARVFGLNDRGLIAERMVADLVLVQGNPDRVITETRNIVMTWKAGKARSGIISIESQN
jgi:imidazolonepropionase-like amidohydrolase